MRKKIVLGSCFATFLMLSIAWIGPVQANSSDIMATLDKISGDLVNDQNFINLLNDPDVEEYINLLMDENSEWNEDFYSNLEVIINNIIEKAEFQNLIATYESDILYLDQKISEKNVHSLPDAPSGIYYSLTNQINGLKIEKQSSPDMEDESILISSTDDSINIFGLGILRGFFLNILIKILNFFGTMTRILGKTINFLATILSIVAFFIAFFDEETGKMLDEIVGLASTIASVLLTISGIISTVSSILEFFYKIIRARTKNTTIIKTPFTRFFERIYRIIQLFRPTPHRLAI